VQFPVDFLLKLGMIPNPYLRYYYFPEKVLEEAKREPKTRGEKVKEMNEALFAALKEGKRKPLEIYNDYIERRESHGGFLGRRESHGENTGRGESQYGEVKESFNLEEGEGYIKVALELLRGLSGFKVGTPVVNLRNRSAILGMEESDVVEVPVHLLKGFIRPVASGTVPQECLELMKNVKLYEKKLIQGIVGGSREGVIEALSLNPLVGSLDLARKLVEEFSVKQCWGQVLQSYI